MIPDKNLFRPDEVAKLLSLHIDTIYRWIKEGRLDGIRLPNGQIRIKKESVIKILPAIACNCLQLSVDDKIPHS